MRFRLCVFLTVCSIAPFSGAAPIKVFVMAGQSNMFGAANTNDLPTELQSGQSDVLYSWELGTNPTDTYYSNGFEQLRPISAHGTSFGSEVTFGRAVADELAEDVAIIKVAYNGKGLERWWAPFRNELYPLLVDHVAAALTDLTDQGYEPDLAALIWVQSQADANWEYAAARYEHNLDRFVGSFRTEFGVSDLAFIQNQHHADSNASHGDIVRQQKNNFTDKDADNHLVNIDSHNLKNDNVHLSSLAQIELGYRLADAYLSSVSEILPGDYNGDGFVSQADLDLVLMNWGDNVAPAGWLALDQFDGVQVSQNELDGVLLNWGIGTPPALAIPEPATAAAMLSGLVVMVRRRRCVNAPPATTVGTGRDWAGEVVCGKKYCNYSTQRPKSALNGTMPIAFLP